MSQTLINTKQKKGNRTGKPRAKKPNPTSTIKSLRDNNFLCMSFLLPHLVSPNSSQSANNKNQTREKCLISTIIAIHEPEFPAASASLFGSLSYSDEPFS
jgi:hypothetical protein